jgi:prepilin signal peptidase PulO-like enzyme (type II secretory pathway)
MGSVLFLFLPGLGFAGGLGLLSAQPEWAWLREPGSYPWELWAIALGGGVATCGGFLDWRFHRTQKLVMGPKEQRYELMALGLGGFPLFLLMSLASLSPHPAQYLLGVLVVLLFTVVLICYDEFVFHRKRCGNYENFLHRLLVFGNGFAWLAWAHWCFVKGGLHGFA